MDKRVIKPKCIICKKELKEAEKLNNKEVDNEK